MLVLSRKVGETVIIGERLARVTVIRISGSQVKLGFQAPEGTPVNREEVVERGERGEAA